MERYPDGRAAPGYRAAMRILGMDEAGRGSVLGPMVVGAFCCAEADIDKLVEAGADDSKKLTKKRRAAAREKLRDLGEHAIVRVTAREIDAGNINTLEERVFADLVARFAPEHVIIDAPVHPRGIPAFTKRLVAAIEARGAAVPTFTIEPKADGNYPPVGAASIFAKLDRDEAIAGLGAVGSGYPSDPKTRAVIRGYLQRGEALPAWVRSRWGTIDALRQEALFPAPS